MHWNFKPGKPYFVLDPEGDGMSYFATAEERDAFAAEQIQKHLDCDGWGEFVGCIVAGVVTHQAQQTERVERPENIDEYGIDEEGDYWLEEWDYKCRYELLPVDGA